MLRPMKSRDRFTSSTCPKVAGLYIVHMASLQGSLLLPRRRLILSVLSAYCRKSRKVSPIPAIVQQTCEVSLMPLFTDVKCVVVSLYRRYTLFPSIWKNPKYQFLDLLSSLLWTHP